MVCSCSTEEEASTQFTLRQSITAFLNALNSSIEIIVLSFLCLILPT